MAMRIGIREKTYYCQEPVKAKSLITLKLIYFLSWMSNTNLAEVADRRQLLLNRRTLTIKMHADISDCWPKAILAAKIYT